MLPKYPFALYALLLLQTYADAGELAEVDNSDRFSFEIQIGAEVEPAYTGSDELLSEADLNLSVSYQSEAGHRYFLSLGELGVDWALGANLKLRTNFEYEFGRDNDADSALANFPEVEDTVEAQAILFWQAGSWLIGSGIQYDILNRGKGLVGFVGAGYETALRTNLIWQTRVDLSFADNEHLFVEVGVDSITANANGYNAYTPKSGYKGASAQMQLQFEFVPQWSLQGTVGVEHYGKIMSDSPIIAVDGTDTTFEASLGVAYTF